MDSNNIAEKIVGKTYSEALDKTLEKIRSRAVDLSVRHILFTPDKYTLYCERKLYEGTNGAFDAEVLTLNRLFFRVCNNSEGAYLSKFGAIMLTRKIIASVKKSFKCFVRCADFKGFAEKMYENIAQMFACKIAPSELSGFDGALGLKLHDISLIYSEYLRLTKGLFVDSGGRMELLLDSLATSDYFDNAVCYFANFDSCTEQTKQVIQAICNKSKACFIGEVSGEDAPCKNVEVYESGNKAEQVKAIAKRIRNNAVMGVSYGDMAVVTPSNYGYSKIMRIFSEFEIPYYIDTKCNLGAHPLGLYYKQIFDAASKIGRQEYVTLSKNPYLAISKNEQDIFECYLLKYCIDYLSLAEPFTKGYTNNALKPCDLQENENLIIAEKVRKQLHGVVYFARQKLENAKNSIEFLSAIKLILPPSATEITRQIAEISAQDIGDATEQIINVATVLTTIFGDNYYPSEQLQQAFIEGLDAVDISLIPAKTNCVTIGEFTAFRGSKFKALYILDFNENFPPSSPDCGIITDSEIQILKEKKINLEPKIADVNERNFIQAKSLLSACDELFVTYLSSERAGILMSYLQDFSQSVVKNSPELERARLEENNNFDLIARHVSCASNAAEMLGTGVCARLQGENGYGFESELNASLGQGAKRFLPKPPNSSDFLQNANSLFFKNNSISISRIQEYFSCPYKHFLKYGLALKKRDDGVLSVFDVGIFLHRVIELFVSLGRLDSVDVDAQNIIDQIIEQEPKYALESFKAVMELMREEASGLAHIVASQIKAGEFKNFGVEIHFDKGENLLKTLSFKVGEKQIYISGVMDRVDTLGEYARVIDYKTGSIKFEWSDIYYGLKIQLLIYMKILVENGFKPAGMFYFPLSSKWSDDEFSHRLCGIFSNENEIFEGMDVGLCEAGYKSEVINARTKVKKNKDDITELAKNNFIYSTAELYEFLQYAYSVLKLGAREINEGYIRKTPIKKYDKTACSYCDMRELCGFDSKSGQSRKIKNIKPAFILESCGKGG